MDLHAVLPQEDSEEGIKDDLCKICNLTAAKYTCPRCNTPYCTIHCYRSENHQHCSEAFYKGCIEQNLSAEDGSIDGVKEMMEILQRHNVQQNNDSHSVPVDTEGDYSDDELLDSDDDESVTDLKKRMEGIDLDNVKEVWDRLTPDERQDFEAFARQNYTVQMNEQDSWKPWWFNCHPDSLDHAELGEKYKEGCPKILSTIPKFSEITKTPPHECIKYNIVNVIAAASHMMLFFNGEHAQHPREALQCLTELCDVMRENATFHTAEQTIKTVISNRRKSVWLNVEQVTDPEDENSNTSIESTEKAVLQIYMGPVHKDPNFYLLCLLSELYRLTESALSAKFSKGDKSNNVATVYQHFPPPAKGKRHYFLYGKKLLYFMAYIEEHHHNIDYIWEYFRSDHSTYKHMVDCSVR